jgi:hypothetical protein
MKPRTSSGECDRTNQDSAMRRTAKGGIGNIESAFKLVMMKNPRPRLFTGR